MDGSDVPRHAVLPRQAPLCHVHATRGLLSRGKAVGSPHRPSKGPLARSPGSPSRMGLFLVRRARICITRATSRSRLRTCARRVMRGWIARGAACERLPLAA
jgi:hypothetical protein